MKLPLVIAACVLFHLISLGNSQTSTCDSTLTIYATLLQNVITAEKVVINLYLSPLNVNVAIFVNNMNLYGVINNAGITLDKSILFQPENDIDRLLHINLKAR